MRNLLPVRGLYVYFVRVKDPSGYDRKSAHLSLLCLGGNAQLLKFGGTEMLLSIHDIRC